MTLEIMPPRGATNWLTDHTTHGMSAAFGGTRAGLVWLPVVLVLGLLTWEMLAVPSDAESQRAPAPSSVALAQNASADSANAALPAASSSTPPTWQGPPKPRLRKGRL